MAQAMEASAHSMMLRERQLVARCERLARDASDAATVASATAASREQERGALALERVMRAAAKQEETWAAQLKEALARGGMAEEEVARLRHVRASARARLAPTFRPAGRPQHIVLAVAVATSATSHLPRPPPMPD
eukprot:3583113-Prymnesium_polylepis.1